MIYIDNILLFFFNYLQNLWSLTQEMAPWLLIGFLFAGLLKVFIPQDFIRKEIGKNNFWSYVKAALLGVPLPLCSCGVIPTGISLHKNGAGKAPTNAFLISTPQTGIDSIMATYALLGLPLAIARPIIALSTGVLGGWLTSKIDHTQHEKDPVLYETAVATKVNLSHKWKEILRYGFVEMVQDISKWLLIGLAIAALISTILPDNFFQDTVSNYWIQLLIVLLISIPLYVCATGSIPIAASLLLKGISPGLAILFLMAGPATNIATISVLYKTMGKKSTFAYLLAIFIGAIGSALIIDWVFPKDFFISTVKNISHEHVSNYYLSMFFGILLIIIILFANFKRFFIKDHITMENKSNYTIPVTGMTCNHCKTSVENNLRKIAGVESVVAYPGENKVNITGDFDHEKIKETIIELGFDIPQD